MKKILTAIVFAFVALFGGTASAQQPKGDGDDEFCKKVADCEKDKPPPPPPRYRCGEGTNEEGQVLVGKLCTCKKPYRNIPVHDLSSLGTISCAARASVWDKYDDLENRYAELQQTKADKAEVEVLRKDYLDFKAWIEGLGLEDFIRKINARLNDLERRVAELEKRVGKLEQRADVTDRALRSAVQLGFSAHGGGNYYTADGGDVGKFNAGGGYGLLGMELAGYLTEAFGFAGKFKVGVHGSSETDGPVGEVGAVFGPSFRLDPVYVDLGLAWYTMTTPRHDDAGGKGNFLSYALGAEVAVGYRPIPQFEIGAELMAGGGEFGSRVAPIGGSGFLFQGGVYVQAVLGVVDEKPAE